MCAAVACRADELGGVPATLRSGDGQEHLEAEASDRLGLDWVARLEKKLEHTLAAESGSGLLVQPAWIEKNVPDICATNSLVRKISACLCQIQRLLAADRGWGGASAHREAEGRRVPTEFLPSSWLFEVGVELLTSTTGQDCEHVPSVSLTTHRDPRRGLGRA